MILRLSSGCGHVLWSTALASAILCGCGSHRIEIPTGVVSGTVTFDGEPVTEGFVGFTSKETGSGQTLPLGPGGKFAFAEPVVIGPYAVSITPPEGNPPTVENPAPKPPDPKNIPQKYRSDATTDLTAEVKEGKNEFTFDMKP